MSRRTTTDYEAYMVRVGHERIPAYEPSLGTNELVYLTDVIERNWLSEGKYTRMFEVALARLTEREHAVSFANATSAMIAGMRAMGIGIGDDVIVPSFTHPADPNCIACVGATPVFADVSEDLLVLSVDTIKRAMTSETKAVLYVSLYGNAGDLEEIDTYCKENRLLFINDCAAALGSKYKGRAITSFGDFAVLSFFADKTISTGEGGMLLTNDADLSADANIWKHDGHRERGHDLVQRPGYNFRITELQTAVGVAQLERLDEIVARKKENLAIYSECVADIEQVSLFEFHPDADIVPHRNIILVPKARPLIDHLVRAGIGARTMFMPMHSQPCYDTGQCLASTEKLYATGVCLPSAPTLSKADIEFVCKSIRSFYK